MQKYGAIFYFYALLQSPLPLIVVSVRRYAALRGTVKTNKRRRAHTPHRICSDITSNSLVKSVHFRDNEGGVVKAMCRWHHHLHGRGKGQLPTSAIIYPDGFILHHPAKLRKGFFLFWQTLSELLYQCLRAKKPLATHPFSPSGSLEHKSHANPRILWAASSICTHSLRRTALRSILPGYLFSPVSFAWESIL